MILGQPFSPQQPDSQFTLLAHVVGWAYHFSNGITFGVMYLALVGEATATKLASGPSRLPSAWNWPCSSLLTLDFLRSGCPPDL